MKRATWALPIAASLVTGLSACGDDPSDALGASAPRATPAAGAVIVNGTVREWRVAVDTPTLKEGKVTFSVTNAGTQVHEFLVVRTDLADGKIPIGGEGKFDEEAEGVDVVDEISEFEVGTTGSVTIDLKAGAYQLVCNIEKHYGNGMHVPFTVTV
jgi:hypothetical protein